MSDWTAETVFCDDVRQEVTGKHILIGVYGADLVPAIMPSTFPISLWVRINGLTSGNHKFRMQLIAPDSSPAVDLSGDIHVAAPDSPSIFAMGGIPVTVSGAGTIVATFAFDGEDNIEVGRLKVVAPPATAQPFSTQSS